MSVKNLGLKFLVPAKILRITSAEIRIAKICTRYFYELYLETDILSVYTLIFWLL